MSLVSDFSASITICASRADVLDVLLDAIHLADWNPAFSSVAPSGRDEFRVRALGILPGTLAYGVESGADLVMNISIPGLSERSMWMISETHGGVRVVHRVIQKGPLVRVIGSGEAALVPGKRLSRLADRLALKLGSEHHE
ncbi:hypothetical protein ACUH90_02155 [Dermabacteraceae bacterium P7054]